MIRVVFVFGESNDKIASFAKAPLLESLAPADFVFAQRQQGELVDPES
jgi:hypothetical protein